MKQKLLSLFLALSLLASLTAPALAAETAAVIRLTKTTGTVEISKSSGKSVSLLKNMRLYNGYHVETSEESYAWINLDDSKLLKEDAASEVEVRKDGKKLEVLLSSGNLFFDVAEPLENDESMNIRTSTLAIGIRGTNGWVQVLDRWTTRVSILEGEVECSVADPVTGQLKAEKIRGGETALCVVYPQERTGDKCDILKEKYTVNDIPGFVLTDLVQNIPLCDKIEREAGLDIPRDLASVAGGDPSGRTPDRENATPEVLGEADRREDEDEAALRKKLEELEKEQGTPESQPGAVSPDKALPKPGPGPTDSGSGDSGGSTGGSGESAVPAPPQTHGMKLTDVEVQALLADQTSLSILPNTDDSDTTPKKNVLEVDTGLTVAAGKTLALQPGVGLEVQPGKTLQVDGTLTADSLQNDGTTVVTSGNTLRLRGNLTTAGTLIVTSTGRVIVDGTFSRSGMLTLASGATVLAKTFVSGAAPSGWEVSAEADAGGYYSLIAAGTVAPPEPVTYTVTFSANGDSGTPAPMTTGPDGKLTSVPGFAPADYTLGKFDGWYTAAEGGVMVSENTVFTSNSTVYARWYGWSYDAGTLTIAGSVMEDYVDKESLRPLDRPWNAQIHDITDAVIQDGMMNIGDLAFNDCINLQSITIPSSVTSIGYSAFCRCFSLPDIMIPDSVTSIGDQAFSVCSSLTSVTIPSSVTSIGVGAFACCRNLTNIAADPENSSYSSSGGVLFNKDQTELVQFPAGLTGTYAIPSGVTSIGWRAFDSCSGLTDVTIPSSVTSIGIYAFYECSGLDIVDIPDGVNNIGIGAFDNCTSLTSITIPDSVTSIGDYAFQSCDNLTVIYFTGTQAEWGAITKGTDALSPSVAHIHCTDGDITLQP